MVIMLASQMYILWHIFVATQIDNHTNLQKSESLSSMFLSCLRPAFSLIH